MTEKEQRQWNKEHCYNPPSQSCKDCAYYHGDVIFLYKQGYYENRQPFYCTNANTSPNSHCGAFRKKKEPPKQLKVTNGKE
jgi:hypothetical protein